MKLGTILAISAFVAALGATGIIAGVSSVAYAGTFGSCNQLDNGLNHFLGVTGKIVVTDRKGHCDAFKP